MFNGLRIPGVEENHNLLGSSPPGLLAPTKKLMQTMLEQGLLTKAVGLPPLFTGHHLPDGPL